MEGTLKESNELCADKTHVDKKLVAQARKGNFPTDAVFKNYVYCVSQELGVQDKNGKVDEDMLRLKATLLLMDSETANTMVNQCLLHNKDPKEVAFFALKCIHQKKGIVLV